MKKLSTLFIALSSILSSYAQDIETYKKVQLGETEVLTLNSVGGTTLSLGGKQTRNRLAENIPLMTEFIIVNVKVDNENAQIDKQANQEMMQNLMMSKASPTTKLVGGATLMALSPPQTGYKCDFFMFSDRKNFNAFVEPGLIMNYADEYTAYSYPYKRLNSESFNLVVAVDALKDKNTLFLGFRNNDNINAIKVFVNVYALIGNGWTVAVKNEIYQKLYDGMKSNGVSNEEMLKKTCDCFISKISSKYTLQELNEMAEFEKNKIFEDIIKGCSPDLADSDEKNKATTYGNLGWSAFEKGDYDKCLQFSEKALSIDNSLTYVHFNIALVYLVKNLPEALDKYIDAVQMAKKNLNTKQTIKAALDDIANYEKSKGELVNSSDIKEILNAELK
ncbi:MAG: tetratricopeptide repeat protein [Bacteroidia bacterium]